MNGTHTSAAINQLMRAAHATSMSRCRSACGWHHRRLVARTSQRPSVVCPNVIWTSSASAKQDRRRRFGPGPAMPPCFLFGSSINASVMVARDVQAA